jgi:hypothetical protein
MRSRLDSLATRLIDPQSRVATVRRPLEALLQVSRNCKQRSSGRRAREGAEETGQTPTGES